LKFNFLQRRSVLLRSKIVGQLVKLTESEAYLSIPPFEYEIFIPEFTRRQLQMQLGEAVTLETIEYIEGNPQAGSRLSPRLIGFISGIEKQFFEMFCSVDGVGVKKALRAMVRPVPDIAGAIENQDVKTLATLPGIGAATAERIVAKLRRKMAKFALMVARNRWDDANVAEPSVVDETFQILVALGHSEAEARKLLEGPVSGKKKFKDVESLLQAVYDGVNSK
jgi:Holliday junction DNA helicase RuvA